MEALWEMFTEQRALVSRALIEFQGSEHLIMHSTGLPKMQWIAELLKILPPYCRRPEVGWEGCFLSMSSEIETKGECAHFLVSGTLRKPCKQPLICRANFHRMEVVYRTSIISSRLTIGHYGYRPPAPSRRELGII